MNGPIYNLEQAGLNAYQLMEELSVLTGRTGWVELHKTLGSRRTEQRNPPPVYQVVYAPNHWDHIDRELASQLFDLAERYQAKCRFTSRIGSRGFSQFVARFEHGHGS